MDEDRFVRASDLVYLDEDNEAWKKGEVKYVFRNETFHATYWIPETVRGAVVLCHGYGEYINFGKDLLGLLTGLSD
jgi:hypothetical protein